MAAVTSHALSLTEAIFGPSPALSAAATASAATSSSESRKRSRAERDVSSSSKSSSSSSRQVKVMAYGTDDSVAPVKNKEVQAIVTSRKLSPKFLYEKLCNWSGPSEALSSQEITVLERTLVPEIEDLVATDLVNSLVNAFASGLSI